MSDKSYLNTKPITKAFDTIEIGDTFSVTESFRPQDILQYMGVTGDTNPRYLGPVATGEARVGEATIGAVPVIALLGVLTRTVSMHFPGLDSTLVELNFSQSERVPVGSTLTYNFEAIRKETWKNLLLIHVTANNEKTGEQNVLDAMLTVLMLDEAEEEAKASDEENRFEDPSSQLDNPNRTMYEEGSEDIEH
ncbi:MAG: dehydrogenase [Aerococcus sp.]|nr:dehydrogenase [Aerococcus sp.]